MENFALFLRYFHQIVGLPTAFVIGPAALILRDNTVWHRRLGLTYFWSMVVLYLSGVFFTFYRNEFLSYEFLRNIPFNLFGLYTVFLGYRVIYLRDQGSEPSKRRIDYLLIGLMLFNGIALTILGLTHEKPGLIRFDTPSIVYGLLSIAVAALEYYELGQPVKRNWYNRHVRYMLGSYFFILTVLSIVHVWKYIVYEVAWLWPMMVGVPLILWLTQKSRWLPLTQSKKMRYAVTFTLVIAYCLCVFVVIDMVVLEQLEQ
jgi:hypothetical protein